MTVNWIKRTSAVLLLSLSALQLPAQAAMLPTEAVLEQAASVQQRSELQAWLARADVQAQLTQLGVDPVVAGSRVAALSDAEVQRLHGKMQELPAGGNGVVGAIVFIFVLLLVTDILGLTKVFPFTRSIR